MKITETMLKTIVSNLQSVSAPHKVDQNRLPRSPLPPLALEARFFKGPYPRIDFIVALNEALGLKLPDLGAESAKAELVSIFNEKEIALPPHPSLPRLLDKLSTIYLESQCDKPTWIINYPECLSPLSKSFVHPSPDVAQPVAARAELFIHGREVVNCYEEENSPFEQRRKFMMQRMYARSNDNGVPDPEAMEVDEEYLKALEWGLPPTGGWGCGIDRLVMLLTEKQRINDVLTFGNLRSVTRPSEPRAMVRLTKLPMTPFRQKADQKGLSHGKMEGQTDGLQADEPPDPPLDAVEEAILKIKEKLMKGKGNQSKHLKKERNVSETERKRMSIWLAKQDSSDESNKS